MLNRDTSLLAFRLVIVAIFLWHGVPKVIDPAGTMDSFAGLGLPGWLGPITGWVEVIAASMLAVGFRHRWAAAALLVVIVGALVTVQIPGGMSSGLERDALIFAGLLVLLKETRLAYAIGRGE
ncbi:MAG: DoxX family protein [Gemmatimonadota bacterium]|nr:DoxX family protein [Gemmatimonadota bacterium]